MCIQIQILMLKYRPQHSFVIKQSLYEMIFDTFCGIPIRNSFKKININDRRLKKFLRRTYDESMRMVDKLATNIGSDRSTIFSLEICLFRLVSTNNNLNIRSTDESVYGFGIQVSICFEVI